MDANDYLKRKINGLAVRQLTDEERAAFDQLCEAGEAMRHYSVRRGIYYVRIIK